MVEWEAFATICGGAAGALIGLLFVAVSIRLTAISESAGLRSRAAQTLVLFVVVLIIAILLSVPDEPLPALGAIVLGITVMLAFASFLLDRAAKVEADTLKMTRAIETVTAGIPIAVLLLVSGILMVLGIGAGLYVLVAGIVVTLVGGLASAWLFLTMTPDQ